MLLTSLEYAWRHSSNAVSYPFQTQRRERTKYSRHQLHELVAAFAVNRYPSLSERNQLARKFGVTESRIQVHISPPH